jgi:hypothetical protein
VKNKKQGTEKSVLDNCQLYEIPASAGMTTRAEKEFFSSLLIREIGEAFSASVGFVRQIMD